MKRLQIMIEEELDAALQRQASLERVSKAALVRRFARERLESLPPLEADPLFGLAGADEYAPQPVDDVVYP